MRNSRNPAGASPMIQPTRSELESPQQQVLAFLKDHSIPESRQLQVSLVFAESMLSELQATVKQWQGLLVSLHQARDETRDVLGRN